MVRGFVIFYFYITISQVVRGGVQVNRDEVIEEKGPLFEVDYHSILLSLWPQKNIFWISLRILHEISVTSKKLITCLNHNKYMATYKIYF